MVTELTSHSWRNSHRLHSAVQRQNIFPSNSGSVTICPCFWHDKQHPAAVLFCHLAAKQTLFLKQQILFLIAWMSWNLRKLYVNLGTKYLNPNLKSFQSCCTKHKFVHDLFCIIVWIKAHFLSKEHTTPHTMWDENKLLMLVLFYAQLYWSG